MSPQDVFAAAREHGIIKPGLVIAFPQLSRMVAEHEDARATIEAEMDAAWEARAEAAWQATDPRTALQRDQDEAAAAEEAWVLGL